MSQSCQHIDMLSAHSSVLLTGKGEALFNGIGSCRTRMVEEMDFSGGSLSARYLEIPSWTWKDLSSCPSHQLTLTNKKFVTSAYETCSSVSVAIGTSCQLT